jgi:hypothetical protein
VAAPNDSFPAMWFDYDNDGWLDLYVGGYLGQAETVAADFLGRDHQADRSRLYRNKGDGTFADVTKDAGLWHTPLVMGLNYGDLDNDGWLDFYEGTGNPDFHTLVPNRMFRNDGGKVFQDVTTAGNFGHLQKGHGVFFADLDEDGDQDVFAKQGGAFTGDTAHTALFENPGNTNHWIKLTLEGRKTNRAAIGAIVELVLDDGKGGTRHTFSTVSSGGSFGGNPFRRDLGLGAATAVKELKVTWPTSKTTQTWKDVAGDRAYKIVEGVDALAPVTLKSSKLGGAQQR